MGIRQVLHKIPPYTITRDFIQDTFRRLVAAPSRARYIANNKKNSTFGKDEYVRSATYMGSEWQFNFWNSDMSVLDTDFQRIREDGFNSIIIVIPWREFMPSVNPIEYNDYPFERLRLVLEKARIAGLDVYARIGYTWDFYNDENESIYERYLNLIRDLLIWR